MMTRTTIRIDQDVLDKVRARAIKHRTSLAAELGDLLKFAIYKLEQPRPSVEIPTLKSKTSAHPGIDLTKTAELLALTEDDDPNRRQRSS